MDFLNAEDYRSHIKGVVVSEEDIKNELKKAGEYINSIYDGKPILLVSILKGAYVFLADITREINVPCEVDFMAAKSYFEDTNSSGSVAITMDLKHDVKNYHVVIVEDIKPSRRVVELNADYSLFTIPDLFVIGYGLDYGEYYRNIPYIAEYEK